MAFYWAPGQGCCSVCSHPPQVLLEPEVLALLFPAHSSVFSLWVDGLLCIQGFGLQDLLEPLGDRWLASIALQENIPRCREASSLRGPDSAPVKPTLSHSAQQ